MAQTSCRDCGSTAVRWRKTRDDRWVLMDTTGDRYDSGVWTRGPHAASCSRILTKPRSEQLSATFPHRVLNDGRTIWNYGGGQWVTLDGDDKLVDVPFEEIIADEDAELAELIAARRAANRTEART